MRIHDLRHTFASFLVNAGHSLYEAQKLLGHSDPRTTMRYAHLGQASLLAAAETVSCFSLGLRTLTPQTFFLRPPEEILCMARRALTLSWIDVKALSGSFRKKIADFQRRRRCEDFSGQPWTAPRLAGLSSDVSVCNENT